MHGSKTIDETQYPETVNTGGPRRTMDATGFNLVANMPEVRRWLGGEGEIALDAIIADPCNHAMTIGAGGGFIGIMRGQGIYEIHSMFSPDARAQTVPAMHAGLAYMFCETDAFRLVTQVPDENASAAALARKAGFREWFRRESTQAGPSAFMVLEIDEWVQRCREFEALGQWFHDHLNAAKVAAGSEKPFHADDPAHNRAAGAAVHMIRAGNAPKGVAAYNRWAFAAGYAPINILSFTPLVIDVVDAVVQAGNDTMEVLLCR